MRARLPAMALWCVAATPALALDLAPFAAVNQNPFVQIYGLPPPLPIAADRSHHRQEAALSFDIASHYVAQTAPGESLLIDGESYRTTLSARGDNGPWRWALQLPYIAHAGGVLDESIIDWHNTLGFDQGGRDLAATGHLQYLYIRNGVTVFELAQPRAGIGDVLTQMQYALTRDWAAQFSLKLPTGDSASLLGSGSTDVSAASAWQWRRGDFGAYARAGVLALTRGDVLTAQQRRAVPFGNALLAWGFSPTLTLKLQADAHGPFYNGSELDSLGSESLQIGIGGSLAATKSSKIELAVIEDALVATAPDVTFHLRWRVAY